MHRPTSRCIAATLAAALLAACGGQSTGVTPSVVTQSVAAQSAASAALTAPAITVETERLATVDEHMLGANEAAWYDITQPKIATSLAAVGYTTRWPGGSLSDAYHWQTNTACDPSYNYVAPTSDFSNFMNLVGLPSKQDISMTLNYGSNAACNGGGDASEAAAWVSYVKSKGYAIHWWTVGNEEYGFWEYDLHPKKHDPATYAQALATQYYPAIKKADPNALVGAVVEFGQQNPSDNWDSIVMKQAKYDFVEVHYYPQSSGKVSDEFIVRTAGPALGTLLKTLRKQLEAARSDGATVPIYVGEIGSDANDPGKQSVSITSALFTAQVLGELLENGVTRATWWLAYGACNDDTDPNADFSSSLYGWQHFGGFGMFSDGVPNQYECPKGSPATPYGTVFPTARAYQVVKQIVRTGEHVVAIDGVSKIAGLQAYATTLKGGTALLLVNTNPATTIVLPIRIASRSSGSAATLITYDKAIYDRSKRGVWDGPSQQSLGPWKGSLSVTLTPWSVNAVIIPK